MTQLAGRKRILCLDFDGVCHSYTSGWKGAAVIPDKPVPGLWDFLRKATISFEVNIFSSRSGQEGGMNAMIDWFYRNAPSEADEDVVERLVFPSEKPPAFVGIDDRVLTFTGNWPSMDTLDKFKTWAEPKPPRPTIAELDALLNSEDDIPITINPDGSSRHKRYFS